MERAGNLGQHDRAVATWRRGLELFPQNADLQGQIANAGQLKR